MHNTTITPRLIPEADARAYIGGIGRTRMWQLCNEGVFKRVHIGRRVFITRESLDAFIDDLEAATTRGGAA